MIPAPHVATDCLWRLGELSGSYVCLGVGSSAAALDAVRGSGSATGRRWWLLTWRGLLSLRRVHGSAGRVSASTVAGPVEGLELWTMRLRPWLRATLGCRPPSTTTATWTPSTWTWSASGTLGRARMSRRRLVVLAGGESP